MPIPHHRQILSELLDQMDQLGDLLLGDQVDLQIQMGALLGDPRLSPLADEHDRGRQQRDQGQHTLQPLKGRRIEGSEAELCAQQIEGRSTPRP